MANETRLMFTDKGAKSLIAGFALMVCAGVIMLATMAATLFVDVGEGWSTALSLVYLAAGTAGIVLIGRAFATSKSVIDVDETADNRQEGPRGAADSPTSGEHVS